MKTKRIGGSKVLCVAAAAMIGAGCSGLARANSVTFAGSWASPALSASADFSVMTVGSNRYLKVVLTNGSVSIDPPTVLTGLDFTTADNLVLKPVAGVATGEYGTGAKSFTADNVPFETAGDYDAGLDWGFSPKSATGSSTWGITSSGIGTIGTAYFIDGGAKVSASGSPTGGIVGSIGAGSNLLNGGGKKYYYQDSVTFYLSGIGAGFDPSADVDGVSFYFGTSASEPSFSGTSLRPTPVPLPAAGLSGLTLLGGLGLCAAVRRKRRLA